MISIEAKENEKIILNESLRSTIPDFENVILRNENSPEILGLHFEKKSNEVILKSCNRQLDSPLY